MSSNRKYAALPDLDFAPDVYETPELTDDVSTRPTSTALRSDSQTSSYRDVEEDATGISRHHLDPDEARGHFTGSRIDARTANFSDRIDARRKSYRASSRRTRKGDDAEDLDDSSDEEISSESLKRRIARLNREAEELKAELSRRQPADQASGEHTADESVMQLEHALRKLDGLDGLGPRGAEARLAQRLKTAMTSNPPPNGASNTAPDPTPNPGYTLTYAPSYQQDHAMSKAADFDNRLTLLEAALGLESLPLPSTDGAISTPLLPALDLLDRRISVLATTSMPSMDSMAKRVHQLTRDAEKLAEARRSAKAAQEALHAGPSDDFPPARPHEPPPTTVGEGLDDPEQLAKINALYGTLPTIESLAPVLPAVLDRLRSLRLIHADAAGASEAIGTLEQRQADMEVEIKTWREGLEKVEGVIRESEQSMAANMAVVEGWVKDLEGRMAQLG